MSAFLILNAPIIISKFQIEKKTTITGKGKFVFILKPINRQLKVYSFDLLTLLETKPSQLYY